MKESSTKNKNGNNSNKNRAISRRKSKNKISRKGLATIILTILLLMVILIAIRYLNSNAYNMKKITNKLSSCIGSMTIDEVKKSTKIDFYQSASGEILSNMMKFNYIAEDNTYTKICGINFPNWVVYVKTNKSSIITQATIYNFMIISENFLGTNVDTYIDTSSFTNSDEQILDSMQLQPYITILNEDGSKNEIYRYYYTDSASNNDISVQVSVDISTDGMITNVYECNLEFIKGIISYVETPTD